MRKLVALLGLWISCALAPVWAEAPADNAAQIRRDFVGQLEQDGFVDAERAAAIRQHYFAGATADAAASPAADAFWMRYLDWSHFIKLVALSLLLLAFAKSLARVARGAWRLVAAVPPVCYQLALLLPALAGLLRPAALGAAHAYYIVLASAFVLPATLYWMVKSHARLMRPLAALLVRLSRQRQAQAALLAGLLYSGGLAVAHDNAVLGFLAAVCLSALLSFTVYYGQGALVLMLGRDDLGAAIAGHLAVLAAYAGLHLGGLLPPAAHLFAAGLEYYCTLALGCALLVATSPWSPRRHLRRLCVPLFVGLFVIAGVGFHFSALTTVSAILMAFFGLFALEWIGHFSYRRGLIVGSAVLGAALYGTAVLLDHYGVLLYRALAPG